MSKKTRFEPKIFELKKTLKLCVISAAVYIVLLAIAVVVFFYDTPEWARITFAVLLGFTALIQIYCKMAYEADVREYKYELDGNTLTAYHIFPRRLYKNHDEPKIQRIALESVKSILIVAYYAKKPEGGIMKLRSKVKYIKANMSTTCCC